MTDADSLTFKQVAADQIIGVAQQLGHRSNEVMQEWRTKASDGRMIMFAVFDDAIAVASINILLDGADEPAVLTEIGEVPMLNALGVNPSYRRRGLAGQLVHQCENYMHEHPEFQQRLALGVEPENTNARALYEKLGYRYQQTNGQDLFVSSWPEFDDQGRRFMYRTECMLMIKDL